MLRCPCWMNHESTMKELIPKIDTRMTFLKDQKKNLAVFMLSVILRGVKGKRGHSLAQQSVKSFITVQPEDVDIEEYARTINVDMTPQPFVVCRGTHLTPSQAYVILERHALPQPSLLKAIGVCFKGCEDSRKKKRLMPEI
ncbi:uncharacterized protein [Apostichopus japonicus]|uniref:uncharacterized protein n=1 Tax=Stichopus japonicus TaxID=307972 RepID=UPI003AB51D3F